MEANNSILIIGPPKSGKTTFQAQLYMRIRANLGRIRLVKMPENISGLENACKRLAEGKEIETTAASENVEIIIPVRIEDKEFDLVCKDYGGEQVRNITQLMEYDHNWCKRAQANDRWILFIRPGQLYHNYDLSLSGYAEPDRKNDTSLKKDELSDQYHFIELMQALLHARETGVKSQIKIPKLVIVLTCWDELQTEGSPLEMLISKMPLFYHFVHSVWKRDCFDIVGLSAQEFPLDNKEAQEKYLDDLPESFGYLVLNDKVQERDLTRLIEIALNL